MSTQLNTKPWDLSHVLALVNSLSVSNGDSEHPAKPTLPIARSQSSYTGQDQVNGVGRTDFAPISATLGDFGKIWQFLGTPPQQSPSQSKATDDIWESSSSRAYPSKEDYASDGAVTYGLHPNKSKVVRWTEDTSADDLAPGSSSEHDTTSGSKLTKSQRKKRNRKERRAKELASKSGVFSESEADGIYRQTPARKASTHAVLSEPSQRHNLRPRDANGQVIPGAAQRPRHSDQAKAQQDPHETTLSDVGGAVGSELSTTSPTAKTRSLSQPTSTTTSHADVQKLPQSHDQQTPRLPVNTTPKRNSTKFLPSSVQPQRTAPVNSPNGKEEGLPQQAASAVQAVQAAKAALQGQHIAKPSSKASYMIEPKIVRSGEDRHWALLLKLINDYVEDRRCLVSPMNMTTHNNDPKGIHIFVDASNIFIGFNEQLKRSRNIPVTHHVPPVGLSFDALALLMERRRPVARRVLVGSTPHLPAFDKAKAVGYECNILEKVYKARELTERQIYFREHDHRRAGRHAKASSAGYDSAAISSSPLSNGRNGNGGIGGGGGGGGGYGSGSETTAPVPQFAPAKMIEQGVDEILHLKILESIVDSDAPSTMVLATGDAAQAEYSEGFMAMAQRALKKGWRVELVSWSRNISSMYMRKQFQDAWGSNFRVVFLDDYAEELLDM